MATSLQVAFMYSPNNFVPIIMTINSISEVRQDKLLCHVGATKAYCAMPRSSSDMSNFKPKCAQFRTINNREKKQVLSSTHTSFGAFLSSSLFGSLRPLQLVFVSETSITGTMISGVVRHVRRPDPRHALPLIVIFRHELPRYFGLCASQNFPFVYIL